MEIDNNLDRPETNVKQYFREFIRTKTLEELIASDNRVFAEIRDLENEKHYLVTQNYKKFVTATETINNVKDKFYIYFRLNLLW